MKKFLILFFISFGTFAQVISTDKANPTKTDFYTLGDKVYIKPKGKVISELQKNKASTFDLYNKKDSLNFDTYSFSLSNNGTDAGQSLTLGYVKAIPTDTVTYSNILKIKDGFVGVGGTPTVPLHVISATKGSIPAPVMTTTQINAIASPTAGMQVYNSTLGAMCFYDGTGWKKVTHSAM
jgi:hypothetical protein